MALSRLRSLWRNLSQRDRVERELDAELQATLDLLIDEKVAAGMDPREARRRSVIELGGVEPVKERIRDVQMGVLIETLAQDIKYSLRHFRRSRGFAMSAILTLAIGIGANAAMISIVNGLVFRRLPIPDPDSLISFTTTNDLGQERYVPISSVPMLGEAGPFKMTCGYNGGGVTTAEVNTTPTMALFATVTGGCFETFGVMPFLGRPITDADAPLVRPGNKVTVISHRFWTRMFNADPAVLGRTLKLAEAELTVIGVTPEGFAGLHVDSGVELFVPPGSIYPWVEGRTPVASEVVGRLRDGVTIEQAAAQFELLWPRARSMAGDLSRAIEGNLFFGDLVRVQSIGTGISGLRRQYMQAFALMTALTGLLLILMCVNVGGLLLTRLSGRSNELAVRLALGGSRYRVAQQMLVEGLLLSIAGTALAVPLAFAVVNPITSLIPQNRIVRTISFTPDGTVLAAMAAIGIFAGVIITALPVWLAIRRQVTAPFTWDRTMAPASSWWSRALLVSQVAVSVVILIGAALLVRSLQLLQRVDTGVTVENVVDVNLFPLSGGYRNMDTTVYYRGLIERVSALPGVQSAGLSQLFPRSRNLPSTPVSFVGEPETEVLALGDTATPGFFETVGVPLLAGRHLNWNDIGTALRVCVITESLAKALRPDGDVLQRRIRYGAFQDRQDLTIVGIVGNMTLGSRRAQTPPIVFVPPLKNGDNFNAANLLIATTRSMSSTAAAVRQILAEDGREYALEIIWVEDVFARLPSTERLSATLAGITGGLAVLLAVIGIHGVLAYSVSRRTREIGVRVAVGADPFMVAGAVLKEAATLTLIGLAIGIPAALFGAEVLRSLLYGISETDTLTFAGVAAFFLLLGLSAGLLPARRAARIDPVIALRSE